MPVKVTGVIVTVYTVAMIFVNVSWTGSSVRYVRGQSDLLVPLENIDTDSLNREKAFECPQEPSMAWSPTAFPKQCNNLVPVYYAQAGFNILTDIVILLLPVPSLLKLQVNKSKKSMTFVYLPGKS